RQPRERSRCAGGASRRRPGRSLRLPAVGDRAPRPRGPLALAGRRRERTAAARPAGATPGAGPAEGRRQHGTGRRPHRRAGAAPVLAPVPAGRAAGDDTARHGPHARHHRVRAAAPLVRPGRGRLRAGAHSAADARALRPLPRPLHLRPGRDPPVTASTAAQPTGIAERTTDPATGQIVTLFIGLMLATFMFSLNQTILATALPTIVGELDG